MYVLTAGTKAHCQVEEDKMIEEASVNDDNHEPYVEDEELEAEDQELGVEDKELGVEEEELRDDEKSGNNGEDEDGSQAGSSTQQEAEPANSTQGMSGRKTKQRRRLPKDKVHTYISEQIIHAHLHVSILHYILYISVCSELLILKYNKLVYQTM